MMGAVAQLPGLEAVRVRFLDMLDTRQRQIAAHTLAAWEAETPDETRAALYEAQMILHQISGTAGSLGFAALGQAAQACEMKIIEHLKFDPSKARQGLDVLVCALGGFLKSCEAEAAVRD